MSEVRVDNIVDYGGKGAPTFDNGAVISGVSSLGSQAKIGSNVTITSGGINVSGVTTAATLSGNLTGDVKAGFLTATSTVIGSGVTINAGGLNITGVCTATTFEGSGASMTGVAMTIAPLTYDPDPSDTGVIKSTGIGITFDHRILAGSGNVTLSIATNAGAAGTTVENFGVGSSVTIAGRKAIIDPTSDLTAGETYHISYPSGCFTNTSGDVDYVGTAYTFGAKPRFSELWVWGRNADYGQLGLNQTLGAYASSPIQIPGTNWDSGSRNNEMTAAVKTDGTYWIWGANIFGSLGLNQTNNTNHRSSPTQLPGTTWSLGGTLGYRNAYGIKSDNTLWVWGNNGYGEIGVNNTTNYSSPVQLPGTTWDTLGPIYSSATWGVKTDGTLWVWGAQSYGEFGQNGNVTTDYSSPKQIPGTTWTNKIGTSSQVIFAVKTDGTLWSWGNNNNGQLGLNDKTLRSSPVQIPGTTWEVTNMTRHMFGNTAGGGVINKVT